MSTRDFAPGFGEGPCADTAAASPSRNGPGLGRGGDRTACARPGCTGWLRGNARRWCSRRCLAIAHMPAAAAKRRRDYWAAKAKGRAA